MTQSTYRAEIDGLRAVAVLPVIFYHAGLPGFQGGFIGVDIFFVISGFLITQIILREHAEGRFTFRDFYERRARRLMPALFLVILCTIPFAALWMTPQQFWDFGQSIAYTVFFVANIGVEGETGYFAPRADLFPFLHTWSLSVEEQFYLIFPTLLLLALRLRWSLRVAGFGAILLASFVMAEIRSETAPSANFYFLTTRAWELLAGVLLAMWMHRRPGIGIGTEAAGWLGLVLVLAGFAVIDHETPFPSRWTLLPVLGTVLLLYGARAATGTGRLLSLGPLVLVGLISYPAYLWHQPLFAMARIRSLSEVPVWAYLVLSAIALGLAWLTWKLVELPVRRGRVLTRRQVFAGTGGVALAIALFGLAVDLSEGMPGRFPARVGEIMAYADDLPARQEQCHSKPGYAVMPEDACIHGLEDGPGRVAIWGDSHAMVLTEQLGAVLAPQGTGLVDFTYRACSPLIDYEGGTVNAECRAHNVRTLAFLERQEGIDVVVIHGRWPSLIEQVPFNNSLGGVEGGGLGGEDAVAAGMRTRGLDAQIAAVDHALDDIVGRLTASGLTVVLLGGVPEVGWNLPDYMARRIIFGLGDGAVQYPRDVWDARNAAALGLLEEVAVRHGAIVIDPSDAICGTGADCVVTREGLPLYFDDDHVNSLGAARVAEGVLSGLAASGLVPD